MFNEKLLDDKLIRSKILSHLQENNYLVKHNAVLIEELELCLGNARIDLAIINGIAKGIEIKSDRDSLGRLSRQILTYNKIFDVMEIVVGRSHLSSVLKMVPDWWGVSLITVGDSNCLEYEKIRKSQINEMKDPLSVIQLLWKSEALSLLDKKNLANKFKNKSKKEIRNQLLELFQKQELFSFVNESLKMRQNWRSVHQLK